MHDSNRIRIGDKVTIYPRGRKGTWCADFWFNGMHQRQSLQTCNKKTATQRAVKLDSDLTDGKYRPAPTSTAIEPSVEQYLSYLETESRARRTIVRYRGELYTFRDFCREHRVVRLSQITPVLFDQFRANRKKNHEPKTLYHESVVCKQWLKWCVSRHLIRDNPLKEYRLEKPVLEPKAGPSLTQFKALLSASTPRRRDHLSALGYTGMRSGELQRLRLEDIDLEGNWIHVVSREGAETKTRQSRKIPIHPLLKSVLTACRKSPGPWFFTADPSAKYPGGDHWIDPKKLNEEFVATATKLKLPVGRKSGGFSVHSLRHSFETICVNAGIPQRVIDTWLGHRSDKSMAAAYYRLGDDESQAFILKVPFGDGTSAADAGHTSE